MLQILKTARLRSQMHRHRVAVQHQSSAHRLSGAPRPWTVSRYAHSHRLVCKDSVSGSVTVDAHAIVSQLLQQVEGTDGGLTLQPAKKKEVDHLLNQLEQVGSAQQPRPLDNPLLFGNYNVAYTSSGDDQRGEPAGGRFRGAIGRTLFRTTGVFQSVLQPNIAVNKVAFKLFGVLPGAVGLRGKVLPVEAGLPHGRGVTGQGDTVRVLFEPPVLSLGSALHFRIGPPSSVQLSTTYLDERVRLGKGSRGSLFVFTRGGAADTAGMEKVGIETSTKSGLAWLAAAFATMVAGGCALWSTGALGLKIVAACVWVLTALITGVLQQGGIVRDQEDIKRVQEMMQQIQQEREAKEAAKKKAAAAAEELVEPQQSEASAGVTVSAGSAAA